MWNRKAIEIYHHRILASSSLSELTEVLYHCTQQRSISSNTLIVRAILSRLLSMPFAELYQLKTLIDQTYHDWNLIQFYQQLPLQTQQILQLHLLDQAQALATDLRPVHVLSDIDDTLFPSFYDQKNPRHRVYPQLNSLLKHLGPLTCITARPKIFQKLETKLHLFLNHLEIKPRSIYWGQLWAFFVGQLTRRYKIKNIVNYLALFPEADFIWIGDDGTVDLEVGLQVQLIFSTRCRGIFIHQVRTKPPTSTQPHVHFFQNYQEVAAILCRYQIIDHHQYQQIRKERDHDKKVA